MKRRILLLVILALMLISGSVYAQISMLTYGQEVTGTFSAAAPLQIFTFSANANDLVFVEVVPLAPNLAPTISLLNLRQEVVAASGGNIASVDGDDASVVAFLTETGLYSLVLGSETAGSGDFIVRLTGIPAAYMGVSNLPLQLRFENPSAAVLDIQGDATAPRRVTIDADNADGLMRAVLTTSGGQIVSSAAGTTSLLVTVPASGEVFRLSIIFVSGAPVTISVGANGVPTTLPSVLPTAPAQQPPATTGECTITPLNAGQVNVRSGAGETFNIIGSLPSGQSLAPNGVSGTGWYRVNYNGVEGWIFSGVVQASGSCSTLPVVASPQPPVGGGQQPPAPTNTLVPGATNTPTQPGQVIQPTATYTPTIPAVQTAPPDSNYRLLVALDGNASVSDYVSFPGGDVEDVVSYEVTGLNNSVALPGGQADLTIISTCTGTGTQFITFVADGGQAFGCNQTVLLRRVNIDSRTGAVRVTATGGSDTYVQWTLIGSAPRVN